MSNRLPDLDSDVLVALHELMQDDFPLLVETFTLDAEQRLQQLRSHLHSGDWRALRHSAHSFKGSCGNMGALALQNACLQLEQAAEQADADQAAGLVAQLPEMLHRVISRL
ncbi:MAG: Hpt domain-containing protein [Pseudomonadaceae bacterium]|nr:MAG: Hpt domain-containing protein [Pseudomonadaceae bacterium]